MIYANALMRILKQMRKQNQMYIFSGGTIAGAAVGGIVFLAVVVGIAICCYLNHKKRAHGGTIFSNFRIGRQPMVTTNAATTVAVGKMIFCLYHAPVTFILSTSVYFVTM